MLDAVESGIELSVEIASAPLEEIAPQAKQRTDYSILQNGLVVMYHRASFLAADSDDLRAEGYAIQEVDCSAFPDIESFSRHISDTLNFWGEWHGGLDALNDYLSDLPFPDSDCMALSLVRFDVLHSKATQFAEGMVDVFASSSRFHSLFGRRLILLVQVDDGRFHLPPVGASPVVWNRKEFFDSSRTGAA